MIARWIEKPSQFGHEEKHRHSSCYPLMNAMVLPTVVKEIPLSLTKPSVIFGISFNDNLVNQKQKISSRRNLLNCVVVLLHFLFRSNILIPLARPIRRLVEVFLCELFYRPRRTQRKCNTVSPTYQLKNNIKTWNICGLNTRTLSHPQTTIVTAFYKF